MPNGVAALEATLARVEAAKADAESLLVQQRFLQGLAPLLPSTLPAAVGGSVPGESKIGIVDAMVSFEEMLSLEMPERKQHLAWLKEGSLVMVFGAARDRQDDASVGSDGWTCHRD